MIDFTIKAENENVRNSFVAFIQNYKGNVADFMNQILKQGGEMADCIIDVDPSIDSPQIEIFQTAGDKGYVLFGEDNVQLGQYVQVEVGDKYLQCQNDGLWVFVKEAEGVPDTKIGFFKNLNDAVNGFNSKAVAEALSKTREASKKEDGVLDRLKSAATQMRIEKGGAESAPSDNG